MVQKALKDGLMTESIRDYLVDDEVPLDHKLAVANAFPAKERVSDPYMDALFKKYGEASEDTLGDVALTSHFSIEMMTSNEMILAGYLMSRDNPEASANQLQFLEIAIYRDPMNYTAHLIMALIKGDNSYDKDWCEIWRLCEQLLYNDEIKVNIRQEANDLIIDYLYQFESFCI
jgi:hypothetical protein